jgi:hypothetical protein
MELEDQIDSFQSVPATPPSTIKRRSFNFLKKRAVLEELQETSLTAVAKLNGISRSSIQLWKKQQSSITNSGGMLDSNDKVYGCVYYLPIDRLRVDSKT